MDPKLRALVDLVGWSEGTTTEDITKDDGFDVIVTGEVPGSGGSLRIHEEVFTDYSTHPFANGRAPLLIRQNPRLESTASGRYQQILHNWIVYRVQLSLPDFGHDSQDKMAIQEMKEVGAVNLVLAGRVEQALVQCGSRWASFPNNHYGQPGGKSMAQLLQKYDNLLTAATAA